MNKIQYNVKRWTLDVVQDYETVRVDGYVPDRHKTVFDSNGHEFHNEDFVDQRNLLYVIDSGHWCYGNEGMYNHDEHFQVDKDHYECRECGEHVKRPVRWSDVESYALPPRITATGTLPTGTMVSMRLTVAEFNELISHMQAGTLDKALDDVAASRLDSGDADIEIRGWRR